MIALPEFTKMMRVVGSRLIVRFLTPAERSPGGIILPDTMRENLTHAKVLSAGHGYETASGQWVPTGFERGDHVIAPKHAYQSITKEEASVYASQVIATLMEDADGVAVIVPQGEYVLVDRVRAEATLKSGLVLPESARRRGQKGRLVDVGPGRMREEGDLAGTREEVWDAWGVDEPFEPSTMVLYWAARAAAVELSHGGRSLWLLKANEVDIAEVD